MLVSLHVKNLALIDEAENTFGEGFNVLTGETGAGKSVILGAVNMALGDKTSKDVIRSGEDSALSELVFKFDNDEQRKALSELGIEPEEDEYVILKRRILPGRTTSSVNGESVTAAQMRNLAEHFIHVHGQRDNLILLKSDRQRVYLDRFGGAKLQEKVEKLSQIHAQYTDALEEYESLDGDDGLRMRELELAEFEIDEIERAQIKDGEYEQLEKQYKKMNGSMKLLELMSRVAGCVSTSEDGSAGNQLGEVCHVLRQAAALDEDISPMLDNAAEIESLLGELAREVRNYQSSLEFDESEYYAIEERLKVLSHILDKYGPSIQDVEAYLNKQRKLLDRFGDVEAYKSKLKSRIEQLENEYYGLAKEVSQLRRKAGDALAGEMLKVLPELNFLEPKVEIRLNELGNMGKYGTEEVVFYISMNPGEPLKPLSDVASGGELSRLMLALRTLQVSESDAGTMIFDEIDQGISGQTAIHVGRRLGAVSKNTQVICITHLQQIAAMSDSHFRIEKGVSGGRTLTTITPLGEEEIIEELARMGAGNEMTQAAMEAAREMRLDALQSKEK